MPTIPADYINYKTTATFNVDSVPKVFLSHHNTKKGVYGQITVVKGQLKFFGFNGKSSEVEKETVIEKNTSDVVPPQYWHKVKFLTDDTEFFVKFYAHKDSETVKELKEA
ncbi:DUF1971 domain-containing protein [bacterium]|nr:DUF1971 domain-containing protein [bacterium]